MIGGCSLPLQKRERRSTLSAASKSGTLAQSFDVETGKTTRLLAEIAGNIRAMNVIYGTPAPRIVNGRTVVFVTGQYFPGSNGVAALFSIDLDSGVAKLVDGGSSDALNWWIDPNGSVIARTSYNESKKRWSLSLKKAGSWGEAYALDTPWIRRTSWA